MPTERIIGIDFGTSTSVIRVKRYKDGRPVEDKLSTKAVTFNMGSTMLPTLIRKIESGTYYGYEAQIQKKNSTLYQNFKIKLESDNTEEKAQARELTGEFFKYMASVYKEQSAGGHLGESTDVEKTLISYPVKWTDETKEFMLQTAKEAGFPNVEGIDEAQAAIHAVIVQNEESLQRNGYLQNGKPVNIMLIDMGAGTTDIVISEYTPGASATNRVLCTWPKDGDILFGGREVDELLLAYIRERLPEDEAERVLKNCSTDAFKEWKDTMVSPGLKRSETIAEFSALDNITEMLDIEVEYSLSRSEFEKTAEAYLQKLPLLVNGSLTEARLKGSDIDIVILTGGHSQWYFVKDILTGVATKFGVCGLDKIKADHNRVISISLPQETVALGLVYDKIAGTFIVKPPIIDDVDNGGGDPGPEEPEDIRRKIDAYISEFKKDHPNDIPVLYVSDKFYKPGLGTVVTGFVFCDSVSVGQKIEWIVNNRKVHAEISAIEMNRKLHQNVSKYDEVGLLIKDIKSDDIENGCLICMDKTQTSTQSNVSSILPDIHMDIKSRYLAHDSRLMAGAHAICSDGRVMTIDGIDNTVYYDRFGFNNVALLGESYSSLFGIKTDNTFLRIGPDSQLNNRVYWYDRNLQEKCKGKDVISLHFGGIYSTGVALCNDGTVLVEIDDKYSTEKNIMAKKVEKWTNIISVDCSENFIVGVKSDGTVVYESAFTFENDIRNSANMHIIKNWKNIVSVTCGNCFVIGLHQNGIVSAWCLNHSGVKPYEIEGWSDIVAISGGSYHALGLRKNGTVVAAGEDKKGCCSIPRTWKNITAISCSNQSDSDEYVSAAVTTDGMLIRNKSKGLFTKTLSTQVIGKVF